MPERLVYECSPRPFSVPPRVPAYRERVSCLDVIEYRRRSKVRPYGLRMESQVTTKEEARHCHSEALRLASDLNAVWAYIAGVPLFPKRLVLQVVDSPNGWRTNFKKLESALPTAARFHGEVRISEGSYSLELPFMPLQRALAAVQAYHVASENVRVLMGLHFEALDQPGTQSGLFLLAKALELARGMLPGRDNKQRQAALPPDVRAELRQSLHWLYGIANHRLEIRHVIDKKNRSLLPRLSAEERKDFVHDADIVIRGVIERELGIEAALVRTR